MRRIGSVAGGALLAMAAVAGLSSTAHASGTCDEIGTYYCYQTDASFGSARFATQLGSDYHEYAQAQGRSSAASFAAYLDVSTDGGVTWQGWKDTVYNTYGSTITEWTAAEYDGPGFSVRACINVNGISACTPWH